MDLDDDFFGLNKEPVTAVSKNKKSILDSSDDEDGEPSFSFLKTGTKKGTISFLKNFARFPEIFILIFREEYFGFQFGRIDKRISLF